MGVKGQTLGLIEGEQRANVGGGGGGGRSSTESFCKLNLGFEMD